MSGRSTPMAAASPAERAERSEFMEALLDAIGSVLSGPPSGGARPGGP